MKRITPRPSVGAGPCARPPVSHLASLLLGGGTINKATGKLLTLLKNNADADKAVAMSAYMKDRFPFYGINKPERSALSNDYLKASKNWETKDLLATVYQLYEQPERECHYIAIDLLNTNYKRLSYQDINQIYPLIDRKAWWDSVDGIRKPISLWVKDHGEYMDEVMTALLAAESMWQRRVALTLQLRWKEQTDSQWLEQAIVQNIHDQEFFIQKAIGWALRDYSRTNPEWVRNIIALHSFSSLAVREGSKYL